MQGYKGDWQTEDFYWDALAARILHPVQVGIIEALRWIDQPLAAGDLLRIVGGKRVEHHLRRLVSLDGVTQEGDVTIGRRAGSRSYRLVRQSKP